MISILGESTRRESDLDDYLAKKNCPKYASLYKKAGEEYGVRWDLAIFQSCLETGFWTFGNDVSEEQNNFCGLGASGNGNKGDSFSTPEEGIRAQIQNLALRCGVEIPKSEIVSPYVRSVYDFIANRGSKNWEDLTGTWATDPNYTKKIYLIAQEFDFIYDRKPEKKASWFNFSKDSLCFQAMNEGNIIEDYEGNSASELIAFLQRHAATARTIVSGPKKTSEPEKKVEKKLTTIFLDPGHSKLEPGARSNNGEAREEDLNVYAAELLAGILRAHDYSVEIYNPEVDDLDEIGERAWPHDVAISLHHNSYGGSGNPYACVMVHPATPAGEKQIASRLAQAIVKGTRGTIAETAIFSGTNGIPGLYEANLGVISASRRKPNGKPPFHILCEFFFLNKMKSNQECYGALDSIIPAFANQLMTEFPK